METEIKDDYKNHFAHDTWSHECSECYKESKLIKEHERMNGEQGEGRDLHLENLEALEPRDGGTPWDRGRPD